MTSGFWSLTGEAGVVFGLVRAYLREEGTARASSFLFPAAS
jgi:hypothetical protein